MPNLGSKLGMAANPMFEEDEGSFPWVVTIRSMLLRCGPGGFPLPGCGALVQLCEDSSASMTIIIVPVKILVDNGLTILSDLAQFANTEAGSKHVEKSGWAVTLFKSDQVLYIPFGFYPIPIAREPDDEKGDMTASIWCKPVWAKHCIQGLPQPHWVPIVNVNKQHMQALSGQTLEATTDNN